MDQEDGRRSATGRNRRRTRGTVAAAVAAGVGAVLLVVALHAQTSAPTPSARAAGVTTAMRNATAGGSRPTGVAAWPRSEPSSIDIPRIGVRSGFERLGLNPDQTVQVPRSFSSAGWLTSSVTPGQVGPLVILGHVDSHAGPGVFYRLGDLRPGDVVTVYRADNRRVDYRITGVREYAKADFPTIDVYANTPLPTIRLITCGGSFDDATGHYRSNVIAYGQLAGT